MKLLMLKGLPASGKSTFAKEMAKQSKGKVKRVNKDDLRSMIDAGVWSKDNEKTIVEARNNLVRLFLQQGKSVIVDDTNFDKSHQETLSAIAQEFGAEFEERLIDTPLDDCIERDSKRGDKSVGKKVIVGMYERYLKPPKKVRVHNEKLPLAVICDIDGTLAHMQGRSPHDYTRVGEDTLDEVVANLVDSFFVKGTKVILLSGRPESCRKETEEWLRLNAVPYTSLLMRKADDKRNDAVVKKEIFYDSIDGKYNVVLVLDDRDRVVKMWREEGLKCLQVEEGDF